MRKKVFILCLVVVMLAVPVAAFAQSTTTLDITTSAITPNLFLGANIMLAALLGVTMLIAGLSFGMGILMKLARSVTSAFRG